MNYSNRKKTKLCHPLGSHFMDYTTEHLAMINKKKNNKIIETLVHHDTYTYPPSSHDNSPSKGTFYRDIM